MEIAKLMSKNTHVRTIKVDGYERKFPLPRPHNEILVSKILPLKEQINLLNAHLDNLLLTHSYEVSGFDLKDIKNILKKIVSELGGQAKW